MMTREELDQAQILIRELDSICVIQEQLGNPLEANPHDPNTALVRVIATLGVYPVAEFSIDRSVLPKMVTLVEARIVKARQRLNELGVEWEPPKDAVGG